VANDNQVNLYFDYSLNGYCLQLGTTGVASYILGIKPEHNYADKQEDYSFVRILHSHIYEEDLHLLTYEEYKGRINDVTEHEGPAVAEYWETHQEAYRRMSSDEEALFSRAIRRFLAFVELGLALPVARGEQFKSPPITEKHRKAMDAIREQEFVDGMKDQQPG
jgi:hypothetical protein